MSAPGVVQPETAGVPVDHQFQCGAALDPNLRSQAAHDFELALRRRVIGQDVAIEVVVEMYEIFFSKLNPPGRPISNMLFLGPTGTGKTRIAEAMAEALFGKREAMTKVDCGEYQHAHEIAKLLGSPPGYIGHGTTPPLLSQARLDQWHTDTLKLSLLLFDEIEKADDALWQLLLSILDKATITLGDNRRVDFSRCMVFMTSNLGAAEMSVLVSGGLGFAPKSHPADGDLEQRISRVAIEAAQRRFSPEFINRIDKTVIFRSLGHEHLKQILELELCALQAQIEQTEKPFRFDCTAQVKQFLLEKGADSRYGARPLKKLSNTISCFPWKFTIACTCDVCRCGTTSCARGVREL